MVLRFISIVLYKLSWFHQNTSDSESFKNIPNTPDIVIVNEVMKSVCMFEVACCFDPLYGYVLLLQIIEISTTCRSHLSTWFQL